MKKIFVFLIAFIIFLTSAYIALHVKQAAYFVESTINAKKPSCSSEGVGDTENGILFETDCNIIAYLDDFIINEGKNAKLNVLGSGEFQITLSQITLDLNSKRRELEAFKLFANNPMVSIFNDREGFKNHKSKQKILKTSHLPSGWYEVSVSHELGNEFNLVLFISPNELETVLFVESTDTLVAYNEGYYNTGIPNNYNRSNHQNKSTNAFFSRFLPIEYKVDKSRLFPIKCGDHLINSDIVLKKFLKTSGLNFSTVSDTQMDLKQTYDGVRLIIFGAHNEYWTKSKIYNLTQFVSGGGKLLFLGGNQAYREIIREPNGWLISNSSFKDSQRNFRKIKNLMGTYFKGDMGTSAPFKLLGLDTWNKAFGIEIDKSLTFGHRTDFPYCKSPIGLKRGFSGASHHETDQLIEGADGFKLLAKGMQDNGGADVVVKEFKGGGELLNFSSVGLWHSLSDPYIADLINSFIHKNR